MGAPPCLRSAEKAPGLEAEEVEAALRLLDTDASGAIDFREWVVWWCSRSAEVRG